MSELTKLFLQTRSGERIYFYADGSHDLTPDRIRDEDIAWSLSHIFRYAGHAKPGMTVAEHCWRVSYVEPEDHALAKLVHDFAEYLTGDIPSPLKLILHPVLKPLENSLQAVIAERYGTEWPQPACVKDADNILFVTECRDLMGGDNWPSPAEPLSTPIVPMPRLLARALLLARLDELRARRTLRRYYLGVVPTMQWLWWRLRSAAARTRKALASPGR